MFRLGVTMKEGTLLAVLYMRQHDERALVPFARGIRAVCSIDK